MMQQVWIPLDKRFRPEQLGFLPDILLASDRRSVKEQLEDRYAHGGGWRPMRTPKWKFNHDTLVIRFPGDPPFKPACVHAGWR